MFHGVDRVIACYRVDTPEGPALVDCGPATCFERLRAEVDLGEIRHLLLTHIHLDHAGAAGHVVRENPNITVHVSDVGAPHVADWAKLMASARRLYGDTLDKAYGQPVAVPEDNILIVWGTAAGLNSFPTPGHASHHISFLDDEGTLYAGDAAGVRILPGEMVIRPRRRPTSTSKPGTPRSTRSSSTSRRGSRSATSASSRGPRRSRSTSSASARRSRPGRSACAPG